MAANLRGKIRNSPDVALIKCGLRKPGLIQQSHEASVGLRGGIRPTPLQEDSELALHRNCIRRDFKNGGHMWSCPCGCVAAEEPDAVPLQQSGKFWRSDNNFYPRARELDALEQRFEYTLRSSRRGYFQDLRDTLTGTAKFV
jgi:hypothetical protein